MVLFIVCRRQPDTGERGDKQIINLNIEEHGKLKSNLQTYLDARQKGETQTIDYHCVVQVNPQKIILIKEKSYTDQRALLYFTVHATLANKVVIRPSVRLSIHSEQGTSTSE